MDGNMECYGGGSIFGAIFGTIIAIALLGVLAWWIYKKYYLKHQKGGFDDSSSTSSFIFY